VTEIQNDIAALMSLKTGFPPPLYGSASPASVG